AREFSRRSRGAPGFSRQRVCIHPRVVLDRVRPDLGAGPAGGLITRALRHAVVRRDGREIGRLHSAVRFLIAWSPVIAWMAYVGNPMFGDVRAMSPAAAYAVAGLALLSVA